MYKIQTIPRRVQNFLKFPSGIGKIREKLKIKKGSSSKASTWKNIDITTPPNKLPNKTPSQIEIPLQNPHPSPMAR